MAKNKFGKTVKVDSPYARYKLDGFEWVVLKTYQSADNEKKNSYARWYTACRSPFTYGSWEYGDAYINEIIGAGAELVGSTPEWRDEYVRQTIIKINISIWSSYVCLMAQQPSATNIERTMIMVNYTEKEIRNTIVEIYKELNKDYETLLEDGQYDTIAYDVGYLESLCMIIGKHNLGSKIYEKFMSNFSTRQQQFMEDRNAQYKKKITYI